MEQCTVSRDAEIQGTGWHRLEVVDHACTVYSKEEGPGEVTCVFHTVYASLDGDRQLLQTTVKHSTG